MAVSCHIQFIILLLLFINYKAKAIILTMFAMALFQTAGPSLNLNACHTRHYFLTDLSIIIIILQLF